MPPILLLLLLFVTSSTAEPISSAQTDFLAKLIHFRVIQEPSHPMFHHGVAYYWFGEYVPSPEFPQTCIVYSSHPDFPFVGSVFANGTLPSAALFGCRMHQMCRGSKCVEPLTHFNVVTYCLMAIIILLSVCLCCGEPKQKRMEVKALPRPRRKMPRDSSFDNIFLPREQVLRIVYPRGNSQ